MLKYQQKLERELNIFSNLLKKKQLETRITLKKQQSLQT